MVYFARQVFDDSSDEENEIVEKIDNYAEYTILNMNDNHWKMHFRMTTTTFEDLVEKINIVFTETNLNVSNVGYPKTNKLEKELIITIWYLGNLESLRFLSHYF